MLIEVGTKAPAFELPDQNGVMHTLEEYKGKKVILYFYPKDHTPGCTKQACGFSERYPQFLEKGAVVLGVSKDCWNILCCGHWTHRLLYIGRVLCCILYVSIHGNCQIYGKAGAVVGNGKSDQ